MTTDARRLNAMLDRCLGASETAPGENTASILRMKHMHTIMHDHDAYIDMAIDKTGAFTISKLIGATRQENVRNVSITGKIWYIIQIDYASSLHDEPTHPTADNPINSDIMLNSKGFRCKLENGEIFTIHCRVNEKPCKIFFRVNDADFHTMQTWFHDSPKPWMDGSV